MIKLMRKSMLLYITKTSFFIFLLCSIFAIIWLRSNLVAIEYEISSLESKKAEKQRETRLLTAERAELLSFQKIKMVSAREGLTRADRARVLVVKRETDTLKASFRGSPRNHGFSGVTDVTR
jgi:cell division protein FtsL